jgi:hypothetical protein
MSWVFQSANSGNHIAYGLRIFVPSCPIAADGSLSPKAVREQSDLVVSGGRGCAIVPVRFGMPPEIVVVSITGAQTVGDQRKWVKVGRLATSPAALSPHVGCPRRGILDLSTDRLESIEMLSLEVPLRQREGFMRQST